MRAHQLAALAAAATVALSACGAAKVSQASGSTPAASPSMSMSPSASLPGPVAATSVAITNFSFSPQVIRVTPGTEVTWTNQDADAHTVTFDAGGSGSQAFQNGESYRHTFTATGTFSYHCSIHPYMVGRVVVANG